MSHKDLQNAISHYAEAYRKIQDLQDSLPWIPHGDQKTGCIGEYYAYAYLLSRYNEEKLTFGGHSEKGWDIKVNDTPPWHIQVKTVSAFSKTRTLSPIHNGWQQLFIVFLNKALKPEGFWIVSDTTLPGANGKLQGAKCRLPGNDKTGSPAIPFGPNRVQEMLNALGKID
jgi:hypothetical protein